MAPGVSRRAPAMDRLGSARRWTCGRSCSGATTTRCTTRTGAFRFDARRRGARVSWRPYERCRRSMAVSNGTYAHEPFWYRSFLYEDERARGLDYVEDLGAPGIVPIRTWPAATARCSPCRRAGRPRRATRGRSSRQPPRASAPRRSAFPRVSHRAADAYARPARDRPDDRRAAIRGSPTGARHVHRPARALPGRRPARRRARRSCSNGRAPCRDGMLPNHFPDRGEAPASNAVDACALVRRSPFTSTSGRRRPATAGRGRRPTPG